MFAMRDQLLDWDDPAVQELLLKVLVQQQHIMEELCHQVSAARLTAQELSGNARTGSSEFLEPPGSAPSSSRYRPGETEGTSNTEELRPSSRETSASKYTNHQRGEALRANKVNSSAEKADVVSELDIRANECAVVQINSFLDRLLDNGSAFVVVNRSCIKVRNTNSSPQHNVGHRSLCTTTKVKLSHATVFQPKRREVCSKRFSLQEGLEMLQYEPWNPGGW
ncbi:hypothetical protein quinque_000296 [Culex quinquefasciatus]